MWACAASVDELEGGGLGWWCSGGGGVSLFEKSPLRHTASPCPTQSNKMRRLRQENLPSLLKSYGLPDIAANEYTRLNGESMAPKKTQSKAKRNCFKNKNRTWSAAVLKAEIRYDWKFKYMRFGKGN